MALKPIEDRFGIEQIFVSTMQAVSGAGYPGVASMDILGNVVPYIGSEEEKMEEETLKLLGKLEYGQPFTPLAARITAHCNRVAVEDGHTECVSHQAGTSRPHARRDSGGVGGVPSAGRPGTAHRARAAGSVCAAERSSAAAAGPQSRQRHGGDRGPPAPLRPAGLEVRRALAQYDSRRCRSHLNAELLASLETELPEATEPEGKSRMSLVVMKFGGTSVEDPAAIGRTAAIVAGRVALGKQPVVVVSAMAKVTDQLLRAAAAAAEATARARWRSARVCAPPSRHRGRAGQEPADSRRAASTSSTRSSIRWMRFCAGWRPFSN